MVKFIISSDTRRILLHFRHFETSNVLLLIESKATVTRDSLQIFFNPSVSGKDLNSTQ